MRRWVCIVALLAGFTGPGDPWRVRARPPVAIERGLDTFRDSLRALVPTVDWWLRS